MALKDLKFSDLFLGCGLEDSWCKETPGSLVRTHIPEAIANDLMRLRSMLDLETERTGDPDFRVDFDGIRLRVERMDISNGTNVYVCRRYAVAPSSLADIGFPVPIAEKAMHKDLHDGLILFTGKTGSGKTTAAMAMIVERLARHGGVCWTVENPIEINISGKFGNGICYQTEAPNDASFGESVIRILRASPNLIMVGEIRDDFVAKQAIHAATSGHLVVSTFHANDVTSGLARFADKAKDNHGLADSLRAIFHLSLEQKGDRLVLQVESLFSSNDGVRATLRSGDFHLLKSEIERQRRLMLSGLSG